jgi:hypothetical protein
MHFHYFSGTEKILEKHKPLSCSSNDFEIAPENSL